jgi:Protein of unknown function (DUF1194)
MLGMTRCLAGLLLVMGMVVSGAWDARGETEVDLALVLAVDISGSMDPEEQKLQREGFIEAFRSPLVHDAVANGMLGRIAVVYMEWAGSSVQYVVVPWTLIEGPKGATDFADRLALAPIRRGPRTSISGAIDSSVKLLEETNLEAVRRVIDISGDGINNQGRSLPQARDEALAQGITINGLPLMLKRPTSSWNIEGLDLYFRDCVIGGPGAFMIPVRERHQFAEAIKTKIIREIAGRTPKAILVPAQVQPSRDCLADEAPAWRQ